MSAFAVHSAMIVAPPEAPWGEGGGYLLSDIYLINSTPYTDMYVQKYNSDVQNSNSLLCHLSMTTTEEYKNTANRI
jgi:hypothetical protein